jgi:hypothetical protein
MIHKLAKEVLPIIALLVIYYSLVHMVYRGHHIWRKVIRKYFPKYNVAVFQFAGQLRFPDYLVLGKTDFAILRNTVIHCR